MGEVSYDELAVLKTQVRHLMNQVTALTADSTRARAMAEYFAGELQKAQEKPPEPEIQTTGGIMS